MQWLWVFLYTSCFGSLIKFTGVAAGPDYLVYNAGAAIKKVDLSIVESVINGGGGHGLFPDVEPFFTDIKGNFISSMAFDCETQSIFYAIPNVGIYKIATNGNLPQTMAEGRYLVEGMAVDHVNRNLYWTDSTNSQIMVSTITPGTTQRQLIQLQSAPAGIVVLIRKQLVIWATNNPPQLEMCDFQGRNRRVIYTPKNGDKFGGLALNTAGDRLYWTGLDAEIIRSAIISNLPGQVIDHADDELETTLVKPWITGIASWNDKLYWRNYKISASKPDEAGLRSTISTHQGSISVNLLATDLNVITRTSETQKTLAVMVAPSKCVPV